LLEQLTIQNRWRRNLSVAQQDQIVDFFVELQNKFFVFAHKLVNTRESFVDYGDGFVPTALNCEALWLVDAIQRRAYFTG
jgi:hypothetical protein